MKGESVSAETNVNGQIKIKAEGTDTLVIYQLGYWLQKITVNDIKKNNKLVFLDAKEVTLEEVIVKSQRTETFEENNQVVFLDFEFYDDYILALTDMGRKFPVLLLMDVNGNRIFKKELSFKAESIKRDCFENLQLLTRDSVYQVYYNYQTLILLKPYQIIDYYQLLQPCECYNGSKYIFKVKEYRKLKNTYYLYDEKTISSRKIIACVADSSAIKGFNQDANTNYFLRERRKGENYLTSVTEIKEKIDKLREEVPVEETYDMLLKPVESEMKKIDSNFVLFDYTNKLRYSYSIDGQLIKKIQLNDFSGISPKLYSDHDAHSLIFSSLNKNGTLTLYRYDNNKNVFTHQFELENYFFIKNFRIKGNNVFFIYKDKNNLKTKIIRKTIAWNKLKTEKATTN